MKKLEALLQQHGLSKQLIQQIKELWPQVHVSEMKTVQISQTKQPTIPISPREPQPIELHQTLSDRDDSSKDIASFDFGEYQDLGVLGEGGMGIVRRVFDVHLHRSMAMKVMHPDMLNHTDGLRRFLEEAQICAQLQHPNIVPVYVLGKMDDGRLYFTMREIKGRDLRLIIQELHEAIDDDRWQSTSQGWTFRRVIEVFRQVCGTMAYAHDHGVIHCDLKPENIMLGDYGEVSVLDWGIAKVVNAEERQIVTDWNRSMQTLVGQVTGTPAYMSPEQARGRMDLVDVLSDIYSLGAILYEILSGSPPYHGESAKEIIAKVVSEDPVALHSSDADTVIFGMPDIERSDRGPPLPYELVEACNKAMARDPNDRFESAQEFSDAVDAWLDGSRKREHALQMVKKALETESEAVQMKKRAEMLTSSAQQMLQNLPLWADESEKQPAWLQEDEAKSLTLQIEMKAIEREQLLHAALSHKPDLAEAHAALANEYQRRHQNAERRRDASAAMQSEIRLRQHASFLPFQDGRCYFSYLRGDGFLSVCTDPIGAILLLERYERHCRRLISVSSHHIGMSPLKKYPLTMGSYRLKISLEGYAEVFYPIQIRRQFHWDGIPPQQSQTLAVPLLKLDEWSSNDRYIPMGWFLCGGDDDALNSFAQHWRWVDGFIMKKYQVTNREYLDFLNGLMADGRKKEALQHVPRERSGAVGELGPMLYGLSDQGTFFLRADSEGDVWGIDWPVMMVDWFGATAYATWYAQKTSQPWRLPTEFEWEKAARGVDGRFYPWGDEFDPSWACMRDSLRGRMLPVAVTEFLVDESPYGVCGMAGNMIDWTNSIWSSDGHSSTKSVKAALMEEQQVDVVYRGGAWTSSMLDLRCARRKPSPPHARRSFLGFRLACTLSS